MLILSDPSKTELATRDFLLALTQPARTPSVPPDIRERAADLLQHYPEASSRPKLMEESYENSATTQNELENTTNAYDEAQWQSMNWVERLLADPPRTRDIVAKTGLVLGALLLVATAVTSYFLR